MLPHAAALGAAALLFAATADTMLLVLTGAAVGLVALLYVAKERPAVLQTWCAGFQAPPTTRREAVLQRDGEGRLLVRHTVDRELERLIQTALRTFVAPVLDPITPHPQPTVQLEATMARMLRALAGRIEVPRPATPGAARRLLTPSCAEGGCRGAAARHCGGDGRACDAAAARRRHRRAAHGAGGADGGGPAGAAAAAAARGGGARVAPA